MIGAGEGASEGGAMAMRIKQLAVIRDMSVRDLAEASGVNYRTLLGYLSEGKTIPAHVVGALARSLGCSADWIIDGRAARLAFDDLEYAVKAALLDFRSHAEEDPDVQVGALPESVWLTQTIIGRYMQRYSMTHLDLKNAFEHFDPTVDYHSVDGEATVRATLFDVIPRAGMIDPS